MVSLFLRKKIDHTAELTRITNLPRRSWSDADLQTLAAQMTSFLRTPTGKMTLRPMQALALRDLFTQKGLVALMKVGSGKTLVSLLAPYMMESKRPLLVTRAGLIAKTNREIQQLRQHWRILPKLRIVSYELLGLVQGANILKDYEPDLLIFDEVHCLKNKKAGRTRRVKRYLQQFPDTIVAAMSGTFMKHSLKDYAHIVNWALKKNSPLPRTSGEVSEWADALDQKVPALARRGAGALLSLADTKDLAQGELFAARRGLQRRLLETPGVVATFDEKVSCSLSVNALVYNLPAHMEPMYADLRELMLTPDKWPLMMVAEVWAIAREMALGLHYVQLDQDKWASRTMSSGQDLNQYRLSEPYRISKKIWTKFCRDILSTSKTLDTEKQVKIACKEGRLPAHDLNQWEAMEPTATSLSLPVWHDDTALKICESWMKQGPGIVWVAHSFFAEELARRTGAPYYREDGCDANGVPIEQADCSKPCIASFQSNKEGRNLQGDKHTGWQGFSRNLVTAPMTGADDWEQMIGRTHRDGQTADEVTVDVMIGCREHLQAWHDALAGAVAARDTLGQTQKILLADIDGFPSLDDMTQMSGSQWNKKK